MFRYILAYTMHSLPLMKSEVGMNWPWACLRTKADDYLYYTSSTLGTYSGQVPPYCTAFLYKVKQWRPRHSLINKPKVTPALDPQSSVLIVNGVQHNASSDNATGLFIQFEILVFFSAKVWYSHAGFFSIFCTAPIPPSLARPGPCGSSLLLAGEDPSIGVMLSTYIGFAFVEALPCMPNLTYLYLATTLWRERHDMVPSVKYRKFANNL